jgi:hypothetical protein
MSLFKTKTVSHQSVKPKPESNTGIELFQRVLREEHSDLDTFVALPDLLEIIEDGVGKFVNIADLVPISRKDSPSSAATALATLLKDIAEKNTPAPSPRYNAFFNIYFPQISSFFLSIDSMYCPTHFTSRPYNGAATSVAGFSNGVINKVVDVDNFRKSDAIRLFCTEWNTAAPGMVVSFLGSSNAEGISAQKRDRLESILSRGILAGAAEFGGWVWLDRFHGINQIAHILNQWKVVQHFR